MKRLLTFTLTMLMLSVMLATSALAGHSIIVKPDAATEVSEMIEFFVEVEATDTIGSLKEKIQEEVKKNNPNAQFGPEKQVLIFKNQTLKDEQTIEECGIAAGDEVNLYQAGECTVTLNVEPEYLPEGASNTVKVAVGDTILDKLPVVTKFAAEFCEWYDGTKALTAEDICLTDMTLIATWRAAAYKVSFDANGSADTFTDWTVNYGNTYNGLMNGAQMPEPTRDGYTFGGWYQGETLVTADTSVKVAENHTLVAKWIGNSYTVTFDAGTGGTVDPATKTVTFGEAYGDLPVPTAPEGYVFDCWQLGESEVNAETKVTAVGDHTLTAVYLEVRGYLVIEGAGQTVNEGSDATFKSDAEYEYFEKVQVDGKDVAPESYTHAAGSTVVTLKKEFLATLSFGEHTLDIVSKNGTASTKFTLKQIYFTVKFNLNYSTNAAAPASITVEQGEAYGTLPNATRKGYAFDGWYTAKKGGTKVEARDAFTADADVTLYAQWTAKKYVVDFDVNGGSSKDPDDISVTYGDKYGTLPTVKHATKYFAGWYTAKTGGSKITANTVVNLAPANNVIDLYAHWSNVPVTGDDTSAAEIALLCGALALSVVGLAGVGVVIYKKRKE